VSDALALELRGITRSFGALVALDDAVLRVRRGTIHGLLGENGAGKTTLMRVAYGVLAPDRGATFVDGTERHFRSPSDSIATGIGMVQQHPANVPAMPVWENVLLGGRGILSRATGRARVRRLAEELGFSLDPDKLASELPVASQQRLDILKAVSRGARVLVLDEPTAILTPSESRELYVWLREFANQGGTVVVITHKLPEVREHTDDLTVLRGGRTVLSQPTEGTTTDALTRAMIGEVVAGHASPASNEPSGEVVIAVQDLSLLDERGLPAIRSATFDVHAGEIVGVAGVEGSGHHHLLLGLAGRAVVASGSVRAPADIGLVPEDRHRDAVVLDFTLEENVAVRGAGARHGRVPWRGISRRTDELLSRFDVRARGRRDRMATLSGGNQQKVVLARELDENPKAVVAENPTRGLDIRATAFVRGRLRAARDDGIAVVVYSSDLDELLELADRILVVHAGAVVEVPRDRSRIGAAMLGLTS
jgi:general nucleoside transport system ATP-binding protein